MICCPGPIPPRKPSKTWPENSAYDHSTTRRIDIKGEETYFQAPMQMYKRNQIEDAISRTVGEQSARPTSELKTRLKRLLEMDRSLGRNTRSSDPEKSSYAFYSDDSPGKGMEVQFLGYEAFALLTGLRLMQHGWPQSFAVSVMRQVRPELQTQHARIIKEDPERLFDERAILAKARAGDAAVGNTDPVFLVIVSGKESAAGEARSCRVCQGEGQVSWFVKDRAGESWSTFELVNAAHALAFQLEKALPRKRGRSS